MVAAHKIDAPNRDSSIGETFGSLWRHVLSWHCLASDQARCRWRNVKKCEFREKIIYFWVLNDITNYRYGAAVYTSCCLLNGTTHFSFIFGLSKDKFCSGIRTQDCQSRRRPHADHLTTNMAPFPRVVSLCRMKSDFK